MRVGKPVKALPQPLCDYCGTRAVLTRPGDEAYPYRDDHGPLWLCVACEAWIGIRPRSTRNAPLGRLANASLREAKSNLHEALEPLAVAKARRDGVNIFEARSKAIRGVSTEIGLDPLPGSIRALTDDQCEQALRYVNAFVASRRSTPNPDSSGNTPT
jgi:zinc-finger-containing domain